MRIEKITITPQEASRMLENNSSNRPLRNAVVTNYAKQMANGEWQLNGESIKFSTSGNLKDGQHRLSACVKANVPFETYVIYDDDCNIFDIGAKRSAVDVIKLTNPNANTNSVIMAAIKLHLMRMARPDYSSDLHEHCSRSFVPTISEMIEYSDEHQDTLAESFRIIRKGSSSNSICRKSSILLACYYALRSGVPTDRLERFFEVANSGFASSRSESSAIVIRNNIINKKLKSGAIETTKQICFAIADFVRGNTRSALYQVNNREVPYFLKYETDYDDSSNAVTNLRALAHKIKAECELDRQKEVMQ